MSERLIGKMLSPLRRQLSNLMARGTLTLANSALKMQGVQLKLLADEMKDDIEHFEPYGFTACPHAGAEAVALFLDGDRSHGIVIAVADRRYRLQGLAAGEVALYDDQGQSFILKRGKVAEINTETLVINASKKIQMNTPKVLTTGLVEADGEITDNKPTGGSSMSAMRQVHNNHDHGGILRGGANTDKPNQGM